LGEKSASSKPAARRRHITADVVVLGGGFTGLSVWKISSESIRWGSKGPVLMSIHIPRKLIDDYGGAKPAGIAVSI
jgi:hypothetical protein